MSMSISRASEQRFEQVARAITQLLVTTFEESLAEQEAAFRALERHLLRSVVRTQFERQEVRRRIAERIYTEAFGHDCPWPVFKRALRRIQRLGYSNVERRYHIACLYALWCHRHPEHDSREARRLLDETERSLLRLPRSSPLRQALLKALATKRRETGLLPLPQRQ